MPHARDIEYDVAGTTYRGRLAVPDGEGPFPGVLVAHEANGLDDHQLTRPTRLAGLGYAAFALDYVGGGRAFRDPQEMGAHLEVLTADVDHLRALAHAGLDVLVSDAAVDPSRIAAVGYCFGATVVMELARSGADLKAVVGVHPGINRLRPEDSPNIGAKVLMCIGDADPFAPPEVRAELGEELTAAGVDWQFHLYGGVLHSFTHADSGWVGNPALRYDATADARSWRAMLDLFGEVLA